MPRIRLEWLGDCQRSSIAHVRTASRIREMYPDPLQCFKELKPHLRKLLVAEEKSKGVTRIQNFFVKIATSPKENTDEWVEKFLWSLINFCLEMTVAVGKTVRERCCDLIRCILNEMPENHELGEEEWDAILKHVLPLLSDKNNSVRSRALDALSRLQDPDDPDDKVSQGIVKLMLHDKNKVVRRDAVKNLGITRNTLQDLLTRVRDVDDSVRAETFNVLREKLDLKSLKVYQRGKILKNGLQDRSEAVRNAASGCLIDAWLDRRKGDVLEFLRSLDVKNNEEAVEVILNEIIDKSAHRSVKQPPYHEHNESLITAEHAIFWRVLCDNTYQKAMKDSPKSNGLQACDVQLYDLLPNTTDFCSFFEKYIENEFIACQLLKLAIYLDFSDPVGRARLINLSQMLLKNVPLPKDDRIPRPKQVHLILRVLRAVYKDEKEFVRVVMEVVSDIQYPIDGIQPQEDRSALERTFEQLEVRSKTLEDKLHASKRDENSKEAEVLKEEIEKVTVEAAQADKRLRQKDVIDAATWIVVLEIVSDILEFTDGSISMANMQTLFKTIISAVSHQSPFVRAPALKALCIYCLLDKQVAVRYLVLFTKVIRNDQEALQLIALKSIFDIISEFPSILESEHEDKSNDSKEMHERRSDHEFVSVEDELNADSQVGQSTDVKVSVKEVINLLSEHLHHEDEHMMLAAVEGFAKLMYLDRIHDVKVLTDLILLYFNPVTKEHEKVRQCLSLFFPAYASSSRRSSLRHRKALMDAFMPALRSVVYAPKISPLSKVSASQIANYLLSLLQTDDPNKIQETIEVGSPMTISECIGFEICAEILAHPSGSSLRTLCAVLNRFDFDGDNQHNIKAFEVLVEKIISVVKDGVAKRSLAALQEALRKRKDSPDDILGDDELKELEQKTDNQIKLATRSQKDAMSLMQSNTPSPAKVVTKQKTKRKLQRKRKSVFIAASVDENTDDENDKQHADANMEPVVAHSRRRKRKKPSKSIDIDEILAESTSDESDVSNWDQNESLDEQSHVASGGGVDAQSREEKLRGIDDLLAESESDEE